jgi:hypothetical protein
LAHRWQQICQPYAPAAFYHQEDSWYSFLLEYVRLEVLAKLKKKKSTFSGNQIGDLPARIYNKE